jgi:uncharacterized membrane protein HdeD (DUF308 family)
MKRLVVILGIILLLVGVAALVHPDIAYHQQSEVAKIGSFKATVDEQKVFHIPILATAVVLVCGIALVSVGLRNRQ